MTGTTENKWAHGVTEYQRLDAEESARLAKSYDAAIIDRLHTAEAEVAMLRGWLKALIEIPNNIGAPLWVCAYCDRMGNRHTHSIRDNANHAPDCPWRQAAEYVARNAQGEGT